MASWLIPIVARQAQSIPRQVITPLVDCKAVKQEKLDWLADHPFYTKRFAYFVGRRCRASTIQDVAKETRLNWKTIKALAAMMGRAQADRLVEVNSFAGAAKGRRS